MKIDLLTATPRELAKTALTAIVLLLLTPLAYWRDWRERKRGRP